MKLRKIILGILALTLLLTPVPGCVKVDTLPQLEIGVRDGNGSPVSGAYVALFSNLDDWTSRTNPVQVWRRTDVTGKVIFTDLQEIPYYFYIRIDGKDNSLDEISTGEPLRRNQMEHITVHIR
jgi:hypothetical protein